MDIFRELRRRNVFRVATAYLVSFWLVIQVAAVIEPALGLPAWTDTFVVWLGIIGLPLVLIFSWMYQLTPDGLTRDEGDKAIEPESSTLPINDSYARRPLNMLITGLLGASLVFVIVDSYLMEQSLVEIGLDTERTPDKSIAVLPFANLSDDQEQVYFSDGLAEELLNLLAQQQDLNVAARTSSFAFRDVEADARDIARALKVTTLLEGSVRRSGERLRVTAQLIDAENGFQLWSQTYDRELTDVFAIQDEIASAIARSLSLQFELPALPSGRADQLEAYDLYLRGKHMSRNVGDEAGRDALVLYQAAVKIDPTLAPAWAALGYEQLQVRDTSVTDGSVATDAYANVAISIQRALDINPNLAEAWVTQASLYEDQYKLEEALLSVERAIELSPSLADAHGERGNILWKMGFIDEAWQSFSRAVALDPLDYQLMMIRFGFASAVLDDDRLAIAKRAVDEVRESQFLDGVPIVEVVDFMARSRGRRDWATLYRELQDLGAPEYVYQGIIATRRLWAWDSEYEQRTQTPVSPMFISSSRGQSDQALLLYDALPEPIKQAPVVLEEASIVYAQLGDCEATLAALDVAQDGEARIYGLIQISAPRSNLNLALNRVHCLRELNRIAEADELMSRAMAVIERLRASFARGFYLPNAKAWLLSDNRVAALDVLDAAWLSGELSYDVFADPVLRALDGEPRFAELRQIMTEHVNKERAKLGWPPSSI